MCKAVIARDQGKLIAYAIYSIGPNQRFKHIIEATSDGIFIEKEYRGRLNFHKKADEFLKTLVHETNYILSEKSKFGKLLERGGYQPKHKIWSIRYE